MKVWVMNLESPDDDFPADVYSLSYGSSNIEFSTWLLDAESRAQHGYRTMRG
ncbi:hypothetical protein PFLU3_22020 [Pseudomonas fluorescens]|uniref:Uncharacterized protein n=1 Tax=Pseudomonas fluorescens TaxID=294 RepID=A0A0D0TFS4_PSEFL|nr:hypothetical protein C4K02_5058 [Pseudomonas synxantha]KIR22321.1 hypothetical protein PFLU3_22020 [Pseudomonas fluorescens]